MGLGSMLICVECSLVNNSMLGRSTDTAYITNIICSKHEHASINADSTFAFGWSRRTELLAWLQTLLTLLNPAWCVFVYLGQSSLCTIGDLHQDWCLCYVFLNEKQTKKLKVLFSEHFMHEHQVVDMSCFHTDDIESL